jgi:hypothetical protein
MDVLALGWRFVQNIPKIDRLSTLVRPLADKVNATPDLVPVSRQAYTSGAQAYEIAKPLIEEFRRIETELVPAVRMAYADFERAYAVLKPLVESFDKVSSELVPLVVELVQVFTPAPMTAAKREYDVKWIQRTLMQDLGAKVLPKFGIDGYYGDETRDAVKKFQQKHLARCEKADGWVGPKTADVMEEINPPWGVRT